MKHRFNILFYPKRTKINGRGVCPLFCRVTINGDKAEFSTRVHIKPNDWDTAKGRVKGRNDASERANTALDKLRAAAFKVYDRLTENETGAPENEQEPVTAAMVKQKLFEKGPAHRLYLETFREMIAALKIRAGQDGSLKAGTLAHYDARYTNVSEFLRSHYSKPDLPLKAVGPAFLDDLRTWLQSVKGHKLSTANNHLITAARVFRFAIRRGYLVNNPFAFYRLQAPGVAPIVCLEEEEVETLTSHRFQSERLRRTADCFLFCCFTGLGYSEAAKLSADHLAKDIQGYTSIRIVRNKSETSTGKVCVIPLLPPARSLLDKYADDMLCLHRGRLLPMYTNAKMNEYIKDVAAVCGIGKHLTTHTARKTFATMMSAGGVPLETIRDMLGHSSVTVTERYYVKVTARRIFRDLAPIIAKLTREQVTEGAGGPDNEPAALVLATDPTSSGN